MKVEKIIIKKEYLDVREGQPYVDFAILPDMRAVLSEEGKPFEDSVITCKRERWDIVKVYNPYAPDFERNKNLLIKTDERGIFDELMTVHQDRLNEKLMEIDYDSRKRTIAEIKNLSWWKRLFKQF